MVERQGRQTDLPHSHGVPGQAVGRFAGCDLMQAFLKDFATMCLVVAGFGIFVYWEKHSNGKD